MLKVLKKKKLDMDLGGESLFLDMGGVSVLESTPARSPVRHLRKAGG